MLVVSTNVPDSLKEVERVVVIVVGAWTKSKFGNNKAEYEIIQ